MCNNRCINKLSTWIPFLLVSSICIVVPIVLGASYVNVLIGYGCATGTLILITTLMGIRFKGGLIAASVKSKRRLDGQWAIVTGANSGIGYETAKDLVTRGCNVMITCRSQSKIDATMENIKNELRSGWNNNYNDELLTNRKEKIGEMKGIILDLCSKKSVDLAIETILSQNVNISMLINNAGAWIANPYITEDGIDAQWQANYLAPFYFTNKLLANIIETSKNHNIDSSNNNNNNNNTPCRIINVASAAHNGAKLDDFNAFLSDDKRGDKTYWQNKGTFQVYGSTKLAQILHADKLQEEIQSMDKDSNVIVMSLHPGTIASGFFKPDSYGLGIKMVYYLLRPFVETFTLIDNKQGAQTTLHCALSDTDIKQGGYHANCRVSVTIPAVKEIVETKRDELYRVSCNIW